MEKGYRDEDTWGSQRQVKSDSESDTHPKVWRRLRKQRRSASMEPPPPVDLPPGWLGRSEAANPTLAEMKQFLSEDEINIYLEDWRAGKEYYSLRYGVLKGSIVRKEVEEQLQTGKRRYNKARQMEEKVKKLLVSTGQARPRLLESYSKRFEEGQQRRERVNDARKRRHELEDLIERGMAEPEDLISYEMLLKSDQAWRKSEEKKDEKS